MLPIKTIHIFIICPYTPFFRIKSQELSRQNAQRFKRIFHADLSLRRLRQGSPQDFPVRGSPLLYSPPTENAVGIHRKAGGGILPIFERFWKKKFTSHRRFLLCGTLMAISLFPGKQAINPGKNKKWRGNPRTVVSPALFVKETPVCVCRSRTAAPLPTIWGVHPAQISRRYTGDRVCVQRMRAVPWEKSKNLVGRGKDSPACFVFTSRIPRPWSPGSRSP